MRTSTKTQRGLQAAARWFVTSAVIVSPWLYGSADAWAYLLVCGLVGAGVIAWLFSGFAASELTFRWPVLGVLLIVLVGYVGLQMAPLPPALVGFLSPYAARTSSGAQQILNEIGIDQFLSEELKGLTVPPTLSLSAAGTTRALYLFVAYVGAFLVMLNTFRHWHQLRHAATAIVGAGFVMAVIGLIHRFSGSSEIFWFHTPRYGGNVFGPFTNRNHFAAHANMLSGLALGLFLSSRHFREMIASEQWRERLAWLSTKRATQTALSAFAIVLLVGSMFVSMSRGGILSFAASFGLFGVIVSCRQRIGARARSGIAAAALLMVAAAIWLGGRELIERMDSLRAVVENPMEDYRTIVTLDTLRIFRVCPVFGCGFGAFRHVFSAFQSPSLQYRWLHAHNDWAQLLAEGGAVGMLLFSAGIMLWAAGLRGEYGTARQRVRLFVLGVLVGVGTIAVHSLVDYSLHKPANALLLSTLAGMAGAGVFLKHEPRRRIESNQQDATDDQDGSLGWLSGARVHSMRVLALGASVLVSVLLVVQYREFRGELAFARFLYLHKLSQAPSGPADLKKTVLNAFREADIMMTWGKNNADALAEVSDGLILWEFNFELERSVRVAAAERAVRLGGIAVSRAPADYLSWLALARTQTTMARWDEAELCLTRSRDLTRHPREVRMFDVAEMDKDIQIP